MANAYTLRLNKEELRSIINGIIASNQDFSRDAFEKMIEAAYTGSLGEEMKL